MVKVGKCNQCEAHRILKAGDLCKRCNSGLKFTAGQNLNAAA